MLTGLAQCTAALFVGAAAIAIINPEFTPAHLVHQSETIRLGTISKTARTDECKLTITEVLKGKSAPECVLATDSAKKEEAESIRKLLAQNSSVQAILFSAEEDGKKKGYLSLGGMWFEASSSHGVRWDVRGLAPKLTATWAGGTDMLIRVSRYVLAEPAADVPVAVNAQWTGEPVAVGEVEGRITGMETIEFHGDAHRFVFVGSDKGDRLFRKQENDEAFDDVTMATKLDSRSKRFAWADATGDGQMDLVTWDGRAIHIRVMAPDGTFKAAAPALDFPLEGECLGLAPCALPDGMLSILVSTHDTPFILSFKDGLWTSTSLPASESGKAVRCFSACIVADFNNDGYPDVLQPREAGGLLWKGTAGGLAAAVVSNVFCRSDARVAVGDFNQDGFLDVFTSNRDANELWENDGAGGFTAVIHATGSLSYRSAPGASDCRAVDLNHDGRQDLCMLYAHGEFAYHFNRGFRCFGEEGELRLPLRTDAERAFPGQLACAVADFNSDCSLDLVVAFTNGRLICFYNGAFSKPILRVVLKKGSCGPLTVSAWQGEGFPLCVGTLPVGPGSAKVGFTPRGAGEVTLKWSQPGRALCSRKLVLPLEPAQGSIDVTVGE